MTWFRLAEVIKICSTPLLVLQSSYLFSLTPLCKSASYWAAVMGEYERIDESVSKTKDTTTERVFGAA